MIDSQEFDFGLVAAGALHGAAAVVPQHTQTSRLAVFGVADARAGAASSLPAILSSAPAIDTEVRQRQFAPASLLRVPKGNPPFYDFEQYAGLVEQAKTDWRAHLIVLLGGVAGLRLGEMMALEWTDIDFTVRQITVARSEWKGEVTMPKGDKIRHVPMTTELASAVRQYRRARNRRVLVQDDGSSVTMKVIQNHAKRRRSGSR